MRKTAVLIALLSVVAVACTPTRTTKSAGEAVDDAALTTKVKAELADNDEVKARSIDVEVFRGRVQLNGFVDSAEQKAAATRVASAVDGVTAVENNLRVQEGERSVGTVVDDTVLTAKVKAALIADDRTKAGQINVETREGVVQLAGFVDSATERSAASTVAGQVEGVKRVDNQLQVK